MQAHKIKFETKDFIYPYDRKLISGYSERREAASVLNQMLLVIAVAKSDFEHRREKLMVTRKT